MFLNFCGLFPNVFFEINSYCILSRKIIVPNYHKYNAKDLVFVAVKGKDVSSIWPTKTNIILDYLISCEIVFLHAEMQLHLYVQF
jgi:hypothetical protein